MDFRSEKAKALVESAEKRGLKVDFDSGLILVTRAKSADPDKTLAQEAVIEELGKYLPDVRRLLTQRAIGRRANELLGRPIFCTEGWGTLASASGDGGLSIEITKEDFRRPQTLLANSESLLILVELDAAPSSGEATSEPKTTFLDRLRRG